MPLRLWYPPKGTGTPPSRGVITTLEVQCCAGMFSRSNSITFQKRCSAWRILREATLTEAKRNTPRNIL